MKRLAIAASMLMLAGVAAQARPMSSAMSCASVQRMVARAGAIVMNFTPTTYDRVVADQRYCLPTEVTEPLWVPTRDARSCFAGYTCKEGESWRSW